ncbi:hypothetical protein LCGC14_0164760 [marine sediment metagenome]|uniref:Uncharacterized protein n=1 Tax=marine sediment metagenome TaxID=412755 RepID=A0A0F9VAR2_9ZZZZ
MDVQVTVLDLLEQRGTLHGWMSDEGNFIESPASHGDTIRSRYAMRMDVDPDLLGPHVSMAQWQKLGLNAADFKTTEGWVRYAILYGWVRMLDLNGVEGRTSAIFSLLKPLQRFYEHTYPPESTPDDPFVLRTYSSGDALGQRHEATISYHEFMQFKNVDDLEQAGAYPMSAT